MSASGASSSGLSINGTMPGWSERAAENPLLDFVDSCLRGVGQVCFMNNPVTGLAILIAMFVAISFDYHYIDRLAYPFYGMMLVLLVLVMVIGHSGGGSQRWINLGFFRLQPSEPAKLAIVLVMA